ncbi:MAG: O-antigen ligase family protein [Sterolibacteriaceae bacterium MAG5]|nr:O-antigen ligase family protein [Candidatus Nitricoxidireducens bremensis]
MKRTLLLLPFALFLAILPFPGTVAARLLLLAICFGIALWQWLRHPETRAPIPCKAVIGVWLAVCLASLAYAFDAGYSAGELKNELGYTMMAFFAFFAAGADRADLRKLLWALAIGLVVIGTLGTVAWADNHFFWNETGRHGGSGVVGSLIVTAAPALAWLALAERARPPRYLAFAVLVFALFLAFITMQRAVWPALAIEIGLAVALAVRTGVTRVSSRRLGIAVAVVVAIAVGGLLHSQQARYGNTTDERVQLTTDSRLALWPEVAARIAENPLAGAGFGRAALRKAMPDLIPADTPALWHAHNVILNYGLSMGVPGMLALVGLFGGFGVFFWRGSSGTVTAAGIAGVAIVAGVLLRNQFNDFFVRDMSLLFWALVGLFARQVVAARQGRT